MLLSNDLFVVTSGTRVIVHFGDLVVVEKAENKWKGCP